MYIARLLLFDGARASPPPKIYPYVLESVIRRHTQDHGEIESVDRLAKKGPPPRPTTTATTRPNCRDCALLEASYPIRAQIVHSGEKSPRE